MFRFTIRDVLWLTVVVGMGVGWWAEHRWIAHRTLQERFDSQAMQWEAWCNLNGFRSDLYFTEHPSVNALVALGPEIIPMIFDRWESTNGIDGAPVRPPWWVVLERITGKKMVSDDEKTKGLPGANPGGIQMPGLEEQRWREWWEREGKGQFGIQNDSPKTSPPKPTSDAQVIPRDV